MKENEKVEAEKEPESVSGTTYGDYETVEVVDWEDIFKNHMEETRRLEKERECRIEKKEKQEKSWELLRECTKFLKENEKNWKREEEERLTERNKKEIKNKKKRQEQNTQKKISETWKLLPEHE